MIKDETVRDILPHMGAEEEVTAYQLMCRLNRSQTAIQKRLHAAMRAGLIMRMPRMGARPYGEGRMPFTYVRVE